MNEQEITALAREYAEETVSHTRLSTTIADGTEDVIRFLHRRYCLVEKDKVKSRMESAYEAKREERNGCFGIVRWQELNFLFPDLTWESDPIEVEIIIKRKKK